MRIPGIGVELKRSNTKRAKEFTDVMAKADLGQIEAAIVAKKGELESLDAAIAKAQTKRKKIAAEIKALEAVKRAQLVGTEKEPKEEEETTG